MAAGSFILMCESRVATKTATDSQVYGAVVPCASTGSSFEDHAKRSNEWYFQPHDTCNERFWCTSRFRVFLKLETITTHVFACLSYE